MTLVDEIREACAWVAGRATQVTIVEEAIPAYAAALPAAGALPGLDPDRHVLDGPAERRAAFFLTLDAINFGSGWFPTLRKRDGRSGYLTVALGLRERFAAHGAVERARSCARSTQRGRGDARAGPGARADGAVRALAQRPRRARRAGARRRFRGSRGAADGSAVALAERLARWDCFADASTYDGRAIPFFKRAQIAAADLHHAGVADFAADLHRLTLFADNLVPHVLRLDGILRFDPALTARIEAEQLIEHDSSRGGRDARVRRPRRRADLPRAPRPHRPAGRPAAVDRGGGARYKAVPRPRARCTAY